MVFHLNHVMLLKAEKKEQQLRVINRLIYTDFIVQIVNHILPTKKSTGTWSPWRANNKAEFFSSQGRN